MTLRTVPVAYDGNEATCSPTHMTQQQYCHYMYQSEPTKTTMATTLEWSCARIPQVHNTLVIIVEIDWCVASRKIKQHMKAEQGAYQKVKKCIHTHDTCLRRMHTVASCSCKLNNLLAFKILAVYMQSRLCNESKAAHLVGAIRDTRTSMHKHHARDEHSLKDPYALQVQQTYKKLLQYNIKGFEAM